MNARPMHAVTRVGVASLLLALAAPARPAGTALEPQLRGSVLLQPCPIPETSDEMLCGSFEVLEDRAAPFGRTIALNLAVLPALAPSPAPDPIFYLVGGPGGAATRRATSLRASWMRSEREVVLVDQRGTGHSNPLPCDGPGSPSDPQGYLAPPFSNLESYRQCRDELESVADLTQYHSLAAMDDLDELRAAMGYERVNLVAGSWGTRFALIYLRRHGERARSVVLNAVAPPALIYGLYHADGAQSSLELLFEQCGGDVACSAAFPALAEEFQLVLERLRARPATVVIQHPDSGVPLTVELGGAAFAEVVRYTLNSVGGTRSLPLLVHSAAAGDYAPLAQLAFDTNYFYANALATGMLLSVVCPGDVARIDPEDIALLTEGTFMGDRRVRDTMAVCAIWPQVELPVSHGEPVESDVPALLWSGTLDPSNPPKWGEQAAAHLSRSRHLVVPGAHVVGGECVERISAEFVGRGSVDSLDTSCTSEIQLPPFRLPPM